MSNRRAILIVEDESDLCELLRHNLEREGYQVRRAHDGETAAAEAARHPPDLVLLDRMLPRIPGDEVLTQLRRDPRTVHVPVVMLTAKAEEADQLVGFALGADDYVTKPFSMKVLLARIAAVLRREDSASQERDVLSIGPVTLDRARHEATVDGHPAALTATEFRILAALMSARGRVLDREHLIDSVLGSEQSVTHRTIDVHVAALRKKLGHAAGFIRTIRGVGYAFRPPTASEV